MVTADTRVFGAHAMSPSQVAHTIIFSVATRLDDASRNSLILWLELIFGFCLIALAVLFVGYLAF